jgi:hypothetical protein
LTEKGRSAFFQVIEEELASREETCLEYDIAIYLLNKLPSQRAIPRLEQRQAFLARQAEIVQADLAVKEDNGHSPLRLAILDHKRRFLEMEQGWLADVICKVQEESQAHYVPNGDGRSFLSLRGELQHCHLPDLIRLIVAGRHSGTLTLTDGVDVHILTFREGQPICAFFSSRGEPPEPPLSAEQMLDRLCNLFHRQEGRFTFDQRIDCREEWGIPLELSAEELILRGCRRVDDWAIIQRLIPSADTILELGPASQEMGGLALTSTEEQVAATIDGVRDVAAIARKLDLTLFETSRALYCLAAVGLVQAADPDKIRLRRVFRELAELICESTIPWRPSPGDRTCEEEVNERCQHLPISLKKGRVEDRADPQLGINELTEMYRYFLQQQFRIVSRRFGRTNARHSFEQSLSHLPPELQDVATRYGFDRLVTS